MQKLAYNFAEAAVAAGTTVPKLQEEVRAGRLTARVSQNGLVILAADLERYLSSLPTLQELSAQAKKEAAQRDAAAARARGRAIVEAMKSPPVEPARQRGREIAQKLLGKRR